MSNVVLATKELTKHYGDLVAVQGVSLEVEKGEIFGFLGPNGSGKTTTIGMMLGLLHPTAGSVEILGQEVSPGNTRILKHVGSLVGSPSLVPYLSGRENLVLAALSNGLRKSNVDITRMLEKVGLQDAADRKTRGYSLGMKQRLGLACALLGEPSLLVLDEPTNGLDPAGIKEVRQLLLSLSAEGTTVFLSSHQLREIEQICDSVAVIHKGRIVASGAVSELLGGAPQVHLTVENPLEVSKELSALPGISRVCVDGTSLKVTGITSEDLLKHLLARGITPQEIYNSRLDLESTFLEITGGSNSNE